MPGTPFWMAHADGVVTYLGARGDGLSGRRRRAGRSPHLPLRLRAEGGAIVGEIGHAARRFVPVPAEVAPAAAWAGSWVCRAQNARFEVAVAGGQASLVIGAGPLRTTLPLRPIGEGRALAERTEGPWCQRSCLAFGRDEVRLVTNRSRVLRFARE